MPFFFLGALVSAVLANSDRSSRIVEKNGGTRFGGTMGLDLRSPQAAAVSRGLAPQSLDIGSSLFGTGHRYLPTRYGRTPEVDGEAFGQFGENGPSNQMDYPSFQVNGVRGGGSSASVNRYLDRGARWVWPVTS